MKKLILFILIITATISGYSVTNTIIDYQISGIYYQEVQEEYVTTVAPIINTTIAPINKSSTRHTTTLQPPIEIDFTKLNSNVIGWIYSEDTVINYPVMQTNNNSYYLKHLMDGSYSASGSIFLDATNNSQFQDNNSILYGHHMRNGSMFASIEYYKKQDYYDEHPRLWLLTPTSNYMLLPFAGSVVYPNRTDYFITNFETTERRQLWLDSLIRKNEFTTDIAPNSDDTFVTLATCDYSFKNARFILVCILVPCFS